MWRQYKHKTVRDLAWSICSQGLLKDKFALSELLIQEEYFKFEPHLKQLDRDPTLLIQFLETKNVRKIGHYFEQLIFFWLQHSDRYMIVSKNTQIRTKNKKTIGEVDLIVKDTKTELYEHWELAVKYYLAYIINGKTNFIGPNAKDYFHRKLKKLKEHQCKILQSNEGKRLLAELEIKQIVTKLFVKGFLYYHPKQKIHHLESIHYNHEKSWWIYLKEAEEFLDDTEEFALLNKHQWLSSPWRHKKLLSKKECLKCLHQELTNSARSIYLACYKNSKLMPPGFVVHNSFPKLKT